MAESGDDGAMRWWKPFSVVREVNRREQAGLCPTCQHGPHRDGPCDLCGDRCGYPKTIHAAQSRAAGARAEFGAALRAELDKVLGKVFRRDH